MKDTRTFTRFPLPLVALLIALPSFGDVVDRTPLAEPRSELVDIGRGAVVASPSSEMFLLHGQRITTEGVNLDGEQIPGAAGMAVGWTDGWLIIESTDHYHEIRHLRSDGTLEPFHNLPRRGELASAAANDGRLAILERELSPPRVWLTVLDETGVVRRAPLARLHTGAIAAFGDGFMAVTSVRPGEIEILHAWLIGSDGVPREFATIDEVPQYSVLQEPEISPFIVASRSGDHAIFRTRNSLYVIDETLSASDPIPVTKPDGYVMDVTPLAIDDGFLVSYGIWRTGGEIEWRAMTVSLDGSVASDEPIDPIVAGDRIGETYLVLRPWGDAGLAAGDPRTIVKTMRMQVRLHQPAADIATAISEGVTLTEFRYVQWRQDQQPGGRFFVRFDANGDVLDDEPVPFPGAFVTAIPGGFAFLALEQGGITMRRLESRGGWIDLEPVLLTPVDQDVRAFAADADSTELLVAWATENELLWSRYALDGTPLPGGPFRVTRENDLPNSSIVINDRENGDRLLVLQDTDLPCQLSPCFFQYNHWSLGIDANGQAIGALNEIPPSIGLRAVGLPDGTWGIPAEFELMYQLSRAGVPLQEIEVPFVEPLDMRETPSGWEAVLPNPLRFVEFTGLATPVRVIGLEGLGSTRFAYGDRLAFIADVPGPEEGFVPWNGLLEAEPGDLSISIVRTGFDERGHHFGISVRNDGPTTAGNVFLHAGGATLFFEGNIISHTLALPPLEPGETIYIPATLAYPGIVEQFTVSVYSNDIADGIVGNNTARLFTASWASTRGRPLTRK